MSNAVPTAVRTGMSAGWIEIRQSFSNAQDIVGMLFIPIVLLVVAIFMRDSTVDGTSFSLASMTLPSLLGMTLAFNGLQGVAFTLLMEREDGTLLRAKASPNGMLAYLIDKILQSSAGAVITVLLILIPGIFLFDGLVLDQPGAWLTLAWVVVLGLLATMPFGAILGSLLGNPRAIGVLMFPLLVLIGISGIFYPMAQAPEWLQWIAQVFPIYWLGLGMRSALLPDTMAVVEIGESWRYWETFGVLGIWAVLGLVLAPIVLRKMAAGESGSAVAERRIKAMQ
ncbi:ABC-type multidrug transport system, permease component [Alloactinosynnema sp. L-07]|uniref:ABC transporter permease n=1 Tax=Alloactinosynnema sp. L-07 TaxID=1653480 RepID=UPI00065F045B|nr:ABC transporter permease [Alloactinosynnema sp. L-07]CRK56705.1 ABC-type multidrug transport system, permease component [Alloactinosynnema sp. L-07]